MHLPRVLQDLLEFCYPADCACCGRFIEGRDTLCPDCTRHLDELARAAYCPRCAMPAATDGAPCAYCMNAGVSHFERVIRLGVFEDPIKHLIHQMKYHRC